MTYTKKPLKLEINEFGKVAGQKNQYTVLCGVSKHTLIMKIHKFKKQDLMSLNKDLNILQ